MPCLKYVKFPLNSATSGSLGISIYMIDEQGELTTAQLGLDVAAGERPQFLVPKGCIFGSAMNKSGFSLVGCMVSPGFTFEDFELFSQQDLLVMYPQHQDIIKKLSRPA